MKKLIVLVAAAGFAAAIAKTAWSLDSVNVDVVMAIQNTSIANNGPASLKVAAPLGASKVSPRAILRNDGNVLETFAVKITNSTGFGGATPWTPVTGTPGPNQYRLSAIWHEFNTLFSTNTTEFQANDVLTLADQSSSATVFFNDTEPADHARGGVSGFDIGAGDERNLFFKFDAPSTGVIGSSTTATVTVTAIAQ